VLGAPARVASFPRTRFPPLSNTPASRAPPSRCSTAPTLAHTHARAILLCTTMHAGACGHGATMTEVSMATKKA
jgi:hypothetical protein